jgi:hypothetical protein
MPDEHMGTISLAICQQMDEEKVNIGELARKPYGHHFTRSVFVSTHVHYFLPREVLNPLGTVLCS